MQKKVRNAKLTTNISKKSSDKNNSFISLKESRKHNVTQNLKQQHFDATKVLLKYFELLGCHFDKKIIAEIVSTCLFCFTEILLLDVLFKNGFNKRFLKLNLFTIWQKISPVNGFIDQSSVIM